MFRVQIHVAGDPKRARFPRPYGITQFKWRIFEVSVLRGEVSKGVSSMSNVVS